VTRAASSRKPAAAGARAGYGQWGREATAAPTEATLTGHRVSPDLHRTRGTDKQGSAWLRWVMNQAAQTAKRSPEFAATYSGIAKRRGKKIATIAIARKLLTRAWHLLDQMQPAEASTPPRRS
jgi:hypothetical protein